MASHASLAVDVESSLPDASQAGLLKILGYLHLQHGDPAKAVIIFEVIHRLYPDDRKILLSLATSLLKSGDPARALAVIDASPETERASGNSAESFDCYLPCRYLLRGQALAALGRKAESARAMRIFLHQRRLQDLPRMR